MRFRRLLSPALALAFALPLTLPLAGCLGNSTITEPPPATATVEGTTFAPSLGIDLTAAGWTKTQTGLYYRTLNTPATTAATVAAGQQVTVRYTLWLSDGTLITPTAATIGPIAIGTGQLIPGWEQGVVGMRVGEQRRLLVPPALAYGAYGQGSLIPGNAVLVFDVEVLSAS